MIARKTVIVKIKIIAMTLFEESNSTKNSNITTNSAIKLF